MSLPDTRLEQHPVFLLRCRTSYSDPEAPTPEELAETAAQHEVSALAVTDLDTLDSAVEVEEAFRGRALSPVVGLEWSGIGGGERLLFYARTLAGFRDLVDLLSRPVDSEPPGPDFGLASLPEGVFVLCNAPGSLFRSMIRREREREALMIFQRYLEWFGRRVLRVVLPPEVGEDGGEEQRKTLGVLAREGVRFVTLGCDESSGEPLSEDALAEAYARCPAAIDEAEQLLEACEFRWEPPSGGLAQVTPGRGYRSESFVWERCQQVLVSKYRTRRREAEKRLYQEFQAFRDANLFDLLVALSHVQGRTSLGHPLIWPVNGWVVSTLVGHLLGLTPGDPLRLDLEPEIPKPSDSAVQGVDITLVLGRGEWKRCVEVLGGIFGKDHVVFRRGKPVGRPPLETDPDLFSEELAVEQRATAPVTEILVSRFRWLDFLPARPTDEGHLETTLPGDVTARLPLYRFHVRRDRLLTILTMAARDVSHQGRRLDLFTEPDEVFRYLSGSDGGRGILRLGVPVVCTVENYLRLRQQATGVGRRAISLDEALDRVAKGFLDEDPPPGERIQGLVLAHKLLAVAALCLNYARSYYMALFSTVELELGELRKMMAEVMSRGIRVSGPDINRSQADTVVTAEGMRLGLRCIRGIGPVISRSLIGSRERQPFVSLQDLCRRTDRRTVNRAALDRLIEFGALDNLEGDREAQRAALAWMLGDSDGTALHPRQMLLFSAARKREAGRPPEAESAAEGAVYLGKATRARPAWEVFDSENLQLAQETLGNSGAERVAQLKDGGFRWFLGWGWFIDLFPSSDSSNGRWGFFSDGESTIPVLLSCDALGETPNGPWVVRGRCVGERSDWRRFLALGKRPWWSGSLPTWLGNLPVIEILDLEPLSEAAAEASRQTRLVIQVGRGERKAFQELVQCVRCFQGKGTGGGIVRFRGDPGWGRRRRLQRLIRRPILVLDLALRWLQTIAVVRSVHIEEKEDHSGQGERPPAWEERPALEASPSISESSSQEP